MAPTTPASGTKATPAKKARSTKKTPAKKKATATRTPKVDTSQPGWAHRLTPEQWGTYLLSGELSVASLVYMTGVRSSLARKTSVDIDAHLRQSLDDYVRSSGTGVRDVVQAALIAFLAAQGAYPPKPAS